jgi:hypothetical protein
MLLSFEYGVGLIPSSREQLYYNYLENSTDNYGYYLLNVGVNYLYNFLMSFFYTFNEIPLNFINISNLYFLTGAFSGQS